MIGTGVQGIIRKNSIVKQDLSREFERQSFVDIRNKIIDLSKKSGLRKLNALEVAKDIRKILAKSKSGFSFEDFKA